MKQFSAYLLVAIFSIFVGSQITEGAILVPYWKSLTATEFYAFYGEFGKLIGRFYTVLTIIAALIPISIAVYFRKTCPPAFQLALVSSLLAILFIVAFYVYFKGANESFFQSALSNEELRQELITWSYWHWGRVVIECFSLIFLILSLIKSQK